jgi:hypothetical protein
MCNHTCNACPCHPSPAAQLPVAQVHIGPCYTPLTDHNPHTPLLLQLLEHKACVAGTVGGTRRRRGAYDWVRWQHHQQPSGLLPGAQTADGGGISVCSAVRQDLQIFIEPTPCRKGIRQANHGQTEGARCLSSTGQQRVPGPHHHHPEGTDQARLPTSCGAELHPPPRQAASAPTAAADVQHGQPTCPCQHASSICCSPSRLPAPLHLCCCLHASLSPSSPSHPPSPASPTTTSPPCCPSLLLPHHPPPSPCTTGPTEEGVLQPPLPHLRAPASALGQ